MKYTTIIAQTIAASVLTLGLVAQASAVDATHTRVEAGSPATGGTREGYQMVQVEKHSTASMRTVSSGQMPPRVGGPMVGGTMEGLHHHSIEFTGSADNSDYSANSTTSTFGEDLKLRTGTRG